MPDTATVIVTDMIKNTQDSYSAEADEMDEAVFNVKKKFLLETKLIIPHTVENSIEIISDEFKETGNINKEKEEIAKSFGSYFILYF